MITAYHHPGFAAPLGEHVMPMRKFALVADAVHAEALARVQAPAPIAEGDLLRAHTPSRRSSRGRQRSIPRCC
jgi:hypothetical protein